MLYLQRHFAESDVFPQLCPPSVGNSFYQQICHLAFCFKNNCWSLNNLEIFDNNVKDGINAFDVYKVAMLLFVVDLSYAIRVL